MRRIVWIMTAGLFATGCFSHRPQRVHVNRPVPILAKSVVRTAESYLMESSTRHATPKDCSDFVSRVFGVHGMRLPRTSVEMSLLGARIKSAKELRMGDLVFFSGERVSRIVGHVGIYVRNGVFIHLSKPDVGVTMESLYSDYYRKRYLTGRRVIF